MLMTADAVGGVWTYAVALLRALGDRVHCTMAVMGPAPSAAALRELAGCRNVTLAHRPYALEWMPGSARDVYLAGSWLRQLASEAHADVVHVNGFVHAAGPFDCPVVLVAHSCVRSWWRAVERTAAPGEWDRYTIDVCRGLVRASAVAAPTSAMLTMLRQEYRFDRPAAVVPNGLPPCAPQSAKRRPLIFAAGRVWDRAKGLATLEAAADCGLDWPVVIAGACDRPQRRDRHVRHLGQVDRSTLDGWLRSAAIYAWPAIYEPFGLSVLEAAQRSCALVLADIPSLRELWTDAAWFVPPRDIAAWRETLNVLARDPAARARLGSAARVRAATFSARRMAAHYLATYQQLCTHTTEAGQCAS